MSRVLLSFKLLIYESRCGKRISHKINTLVTARRYQMCMILNHIRMSCFKNNFSLFQKSKVGLVLSLNLNPVLKPNANIITSPFELLLITKFNDPKFLQMNLLIYLGHSVLGHSKFVFNSLQEFDVVRVYIKVLNVMI